MKGPWLFEKRWIFYFAVDTGNLRSMDASKYGLQLLEEICPRCLGRGEAAAAHEHRRSNLFASDVTHCKRGALHTVHSMVVVFNVIFCN